MSYILSHTVLMDHDMWHLLAVAVLIIVAIRFWKKISSMKEEEKELEEKVSQLETSAVADKANLSFMDDLAPEKTAKE